MKSDIFNFFPKVEISYKEILWQDGQKRGLNQESRKSTKEQKIEKIEDVQTV